MTPTGRDGAQMWAVTAGTHLAEITNPGEDIDLSNLPDTPRSQLPSVSCSPGALVLEDERGRRLSQRTFLGVDNNFPPSQVGHFGKPTPSLQVSAPEEQCCSPTDDEHSRAPSLHSDFKSITTIDDFGFSIGLSQNNWLGPRRRASSNSLHPHYLGDGTRTLAYQPDDRDTQGTLSGLGAVFCSSSLKKPATAEELGQELGQELDAEEHLKHMDEQLRDEFEDSQHDPDMNQDFLPLDKLVSLLNETKISQILHRNFTDAADKVNALTSAIYSSAHQGSRRMIFAVLILIGKVNLIEDFIQNDICDIHLPLRLHKIKQRRSIVQIRKRNTNEAISLKKWKWNDMESFIHTQYRVLAPFFDMPPNDVHFYKIDDGRIVLPFLECEKKTSGGYGTVWKVKIHPAHHNFAGSDGSRSTNPYFAIKEIHSHDYEAYKQEVRVLERFSGPNPGHDHLIRLRVAFQHAKNYYLVFDWAHGNLVNLWEQTQNPTPSPELVRWLMKQCLGIADGLRKIHHHGSWYNKENLKGVALSEDADKNRGRHGDIKPENILCFMPPGHKQHHLVVSDFGLTRFHSHKSVSHVPRDKVLGLSLTYRPPEYDTQGYISQAYDMWSLGCLYLEFVSWFLVGYEATRQTFQSNRVDEDNRLHSNVSEDKFFNLISRRLSPSNTDDARVKDCVVEWIHNLQEHDNCSQCIREFLRHIKDSLLVPDPTQRAKIDQFHAHLTQVYKRCEDDIGYCAPSQIHFPDGCNSGVPIIGQQSATNSNGEAVDNAEARTLILSELEKIRVEKGSSTSDTGAIDTQKNRGSQHAETAQCDRIEISQELGDYDILPHVTNCGDLGRPLGHTEDISRAAYHSDVTALLTHEDTDLTALSMSTGHSSHLPVDTPITTQESERESLEDEINTGEPRLSSALELTPRCDQGTLSVALPQSQQWLNRENSRTQWNHPAEEPNLLNPSRSYENGTHLAAEVGCLRVNEQAYHCERESKRRLHNPEFVESELQIHTATTPRQVGERGRISQHSTREKTELETIPVRKSEHASGRSSDITIGCQGKVEQRKWPVEEGTIKKRTRVGRIRRRVRQLLHRWIK